MAFTGNSSSFGHFTANDLNSIKLEAIVDGSYFKLTSVE